MEVDEAFDLKIKQRLETINDAIVEINKLERELALRRKQSNEFLSLATEKLRQMYFKHQELIDETIGYFRLTEDLVMAKQEYNRTCAHHSEAVLALEDAKDNEKVAEKALQSLMDTRQQFGGGLHDPDILKTLNEANEKVSNTHRAAHEATIQRQRKWNDLNRLQTEVASLQRGHGDSIQKALPIFQYKESFRHQLKALQSEEKRCQRELNAKKEHYNRHFNTMHQISNEISFKLTQVKIRSDEAPQESRNLSHFQELCNCPDPQVRESLPITKDQSTSTPTWDAAKNLLPLNTSLDEDSSLQGDDGTPITKGIIGVGTAQGVKEFVDYKNENAAVNVTADLQTGHDYFGSEKGNNEIYKNGDKQTSTENGVVKEKSTDRVKKEMAQGKVTETKAATQKDSTSIGKKVEQTSTVNCSTRKQETVIESADKTKMTGIGNVSNTESSPTYHQANAKITASQTTDKKEISVKTQIPTGRPTQLDNTPEMTGSLQSKNMNTGSLCVTSSPSNSDENSIYGFGSSIKGSLACIENKQDEPKSRGEKQKENGNCIKEDASAHQLTFEASRMAEKQANDSVTGSPIERVRGFKTSEDFNSNTSIPSFEVNKLSKNAKAKAEESVVNHSTVTESGPPQMNPEPNYQESIGNESENGNSSYSQLAENQRSPEATINQSNQAELENAITSKTNDNQSLTGKNKDHATNPAPAHSVWHNRDNCGSPSIRIRSENGKLIPLSEDTKVPQRHPIQGERPDVKIKLRNAVVASPSSLSEVSDSNELLRSKAILRKVPSSPGAQRNEEKPHFNNPLESGDLEKLDAHKYWTQHKKAFKSLVQYFEGQQGDAEQKETNDKCRSFEHDELGERTPRPDRAITPPGNAGHSSVISMQNDVENDIRTSDTSPGVTEETDANRRLRENGVFTKTEFSGVSAKPEVTEASQIPSLLVHKTDTEASSTVNIDELNEDSIGSTSWPWKRLGRPEDDTAAISVRETSGDIKGYWGVNGTDGGVKPAVNEDARLISTMATSDVEVEVGCDPFKQIDTGYWLDTAGQDLPKLVSDTSGRRASVLLGPHDNNIFNEELTLGNSERLDFGRLHVDELTEKTDGDNANDNLKESRDDACTVSDNNCLSREYLTTQNNNNGDEETRNTISRPSTDRYHNHAPLKQAIEFGGGAKTGDVRHGEESGFSEHYGEFVSYNDSNNFSSNVK